MFDFSGSGQLLLRLWRALCPLPGGRAAFGRALGLINPYTGSIGAEFVELAPGRAVARLRDRRKVRNHVGSVHAIALINLAEVTSGLAMMAGLPAEARGIPVGLSIDYLKKARGTITARTVCQPPQSAERREVTAGCELENEAGELVARATARWMIGPKS